MNSTPTLDRPIVDIQHLHISYAHTCVLRDATLSIPESSITAIIGPSGCGKSSLLHAINRLTDHIPQCYVTGDITFRGQSIFEPKLNLQQLRRQIGLLFQQPNPFPLSIQQNLEIPLKEIGITDKSERQKRVQQYLEQVGLWQEIKQDLHKTALNLSGGQQQRLCLARCLCLEPKVILMDEPCSALDPIATQTIEALISQLSEHYTVIICTHNLAQARRLSDQLVLLWHDGRTGFIAETGATERMFDSPQTAQAQAYFSGQLG